MESGLHIAIRPNPPAVLTHCRGRFLLAELEALDAAAATWALRPLSDFVDPRELPDDFHGDPDEIDPLLAEWTDWFPLDEGLAALDDLIHCLENDPACRCLLASPERTLFELRDIERCLAAAAGHVSEFRLEIR
jgi:hypothetical protein